MWHGEDFLLQEARILSGDISDVQVGVAEHLLLRQPGVSTGLLFATRFLRHRGEQFPTYAIWPAVQNFLAQAWNLERRDGRGFCQVQVRGEADHVGFVPSSGRT